ncbi:TRAP transporter small permease [Vibrio litoralis]|uniref:TRAP transporter small permease n=1 Tax=Vibrio litoralis TaxID=335972 RepID=UPI000422B8E5|nr:TRAP transporter small permease [Vibrio litoralis]
MNLEVFNKLLNRILEYTLIFFMAMMVFSVVWQVFTRFILNDPSVFTDELSRYLLIWIGILGGAYTFSIKRHLALELLVTRLKSRNQHVLNIVISCFVLLFSSVALVYGGWNFMMTTLHHNQVSPGLFIGEHQLLIGYVYTVAPLSGVIICYYACIDILKSIYQIVH